MRDKWTDPAHMRIDLFQKDQFLCQIFHRLIRRPDHETGSDLISKLFQIIQTFHTSVKTHFRRMQLFVMFLTGSLMPQKITVRAGFLQPPVAFIASFAERKSYRTVRMILLYIPYDRFHSFIGVPWILSALQHKSTESQLISCFRTIQDLFLRKTISFCITIGSSQPAVQTVISAPA